MPDEVRLSNSQRFILKRIAQEVADDPDAQPHWAMILLAATDDDSAEDVEERTGASGALVEQVLEKWKEAGEKLAEAEQGGVIALQEAIEEIFEDYEDFDTECFCCCEDEDDDTLSENELEMLAGKVYNLIRRELVIERERLGYAYFGRN